MTEFSTKVTSELERRARAYITARHKQELDHTDPQLDARRTELHDALMTQMDIEGIEYQDREDAARIALAIVNGDGQKQESLKWRRCAHCRRRYLQDTNSPGDLCPRCNRLLKAAKVVVEYSAADEQGGTTKCAAESNLAQENQDEQYRLLDCVH